MYFGNLLTTNRFEWGFTSTTSIKQQQSSDFFSPQSRIVFSVSELSQTQAQFRCGSLKHLTSAWKKLMQSVRDKVANYQREFRWERNDYLHRLIPARTALQLPNISCRNLNLNCFKVKLITKNRLQYNRDELKNPKITTKMW